MGTGGRLRGWRGRRRGTGWGPTWTGWWVEGGGESEDVESRGEGEGQGGRAGGGGEEAQGDFVLLRKGVALGVAYRYHAHVIRVRMLPHTYSYVTPYKYSYMLL